MKKHPLLYAKWHRLVVAEKISQHQAPLLRWEITSHRFLGMTINVDSIIDQLGGAEAAARLTGVGT